MEVRWVEQVVHNRNQEKKGKILSECEVIFIRFIPFLTVTGAGSNPPKYLVFF